MKKVYLFVSIIAIALMGYKINIQADTTSYDINVINDSIDLTTSTELSPNYIDGFDTIVTSGLSVNGIYWISGTNRPKIEIDILNNQVFEKYHAIYVRVYDNYLANVFEYYYSFDLLKYDTNYVGSTSATLYLDYGNTSEITIQFDTYMSLIYDISNGLDGDYGVMISLQRKINDQLYNDGYHDGYENGYLNGNLDGYENGYDDGFINGELGGYNDGYSDGYDDGLSTDMNVAPLFTQLISHIGSVFGLVIFPGVTIGTLVSIPIAFAFFKWFMKMFGGK